VADCENSGYAKVASTRKQVGALSVAMRSRGLTKVLITNFHPRVGGGHATYIRSLLALQRMSDLRIAVATPETSQLYELLHGLKHSDLYACDFPGKPHKEPFNAIRSIRQFRKIVAEFKPDIVHANGGSDLLMAVWSHPIGKYQIVRTHHSTRNLSNDVYHRYLYNRRVARNIYVSETAMAISQLKGLIPRRSLAIANGVDLARFTPDFPRDHALAAQLNLQDDTLVFGSCAGVGYYKRVNLAIEAASRLRASRPYLILVIGDEDSGHWLEEYARRLGVTQFRYCGFQNDVRGFVSLLDVGFVLSDTIESVSLGAREMLAMGKPLISTSFSGLKDNVVDGHNGLLIRPGNIEDVVAAMRRFLEMPASELSQFSANARSFSEENFDLENQLRQMLAVYRELMQGRPA
jgi:L-malate glycosyltransferase